MPSNASVLEALVGRRLPGGCDDCDAYQAVERIDGALYVLTVHHNPDCSVLTPSDHDTPEVPC